MILGESHLAERLESYRGWLPSLDTNLKRPEQDLENLVYESRQRAQKFAELIRSSNTNLSERDRDEIRLHWESAYRHASFSELDVPFGVSPSTRLNGTLALWPIELGLAFIQLPTGLSITNFIALGGTSFAVPLLLISCVLDDSEIKPSLFVNRAEKKRALLILNEFWSTVSESLADVVVSGRHAPKWQGRPNPRAINAYATALLQWALVNDCANALTPLPLKSPPDKI